jgi:hypothetical protein
MSIQDLYGQTTVSLYKAYKPETSVMLVIVDNEFIDDVEAKLNNADMLRIVGKALSVGYRDFEVFLAGNNTKVLEMRDGDITVNWDIVRKLTKEEWNV